MTISEHLKKLENSKDYVTERVMVSNEFIEMVKQMLPDDYEKISKKEQDYIELLKRLMLTTK